ncbi:MAG: CoA pyrophosphatase [Planctomycetota bacterium]
MRIPDERLRAVLEEPVPEWDSRAGLRDAAVLVPWYTEEGEDRLLFTRRRDDLPQHAGEVAFPGGAREGDEDPIRTALRESHEEIGLEPSAVEILGALPPMRSIAGYFVNLYVGRIEPPRSLRIDAAEVAEAFAIPLRLLAEPGGWEWRDLRGPPFPRTMPFFPYEGRLLWGLTALFTLELLGRLGFATPEPRIRRLPEHP